MVYAIFADGFEEIEALTPVDILRRAGIPVKCLSIKDDLTVIGSHAITLFCDDTVENALKEREEIDMLFFPGGMPGSKNIDESLLTDKLIGRAATQRAHICAICAAPMILGHRGLLRGRRATCYLGFENELIDAVITDGRVVTDGNITTAIGMGASLELAHEMLRILTDGATADKTVSSVFPRP